MSTGSSPGLPPAKRSRVALRLTAAAAIGRFELQKCSRCGAVQYPPREACHRCLCTQLSWALQSGRGQLLAHTQLAHSTEPYFRARLPWRLGLVRLDDGPSVIAHLHGGVRVSPAEVRVIVRLDKAGQAALIAIPSTLDTESLDMIDDPQLQDLSWSPKGRNIRARAAVVGLRSSPPKCLSRRSPCPDIPPCSGCR